MDKINFGIHLESGHNPGNFCWVMPVYVSLTDHTVISETSDCEAFEVSVSKESVDIYLKDLILKRFNKFLKYNKHRKDSYLKPDSQGYTEFGWDLTYNFFTKEDIMGIISDVKKVLDTLRYRDNIGTAGYKYDDIINSIVSGHIKEIAKLEQYKRAGKVVGGTGRNKDHQVRAESDSHLRAGIMGQLNVYDIIVGYSKFILALANMAECLKDGQLVAIITP